MPSREQVTSILEHVRRGSDVAYFFAQLTSPEWIDPLREEGLFRDPPAPVIDGDSVRYPDWPAARYLVRVASEAPAKVLATLLSVPDVDNPRVHDAFVEAALVMPPQFAAKLVPALVAWLSSSRHLLLLPEHAAQLTSRLARAGAKAEALTLASALLALDPPSDPESRFARHSAHVGAHELQGVLDEIRGPLVEIAGLAALELFVSKLVEAIKDRSGVGKRPPYEDYSEIWLPFLADSSGSVSDPAELFVGAILSAEEALIERGGHEANDAFKLLATGNWKVMRRIALHLVGRFPDKVNLSVASRLVVNASTVRDHACEYELQEAIGAIFPRLSGARRGKYLDTVRKGPRSSKAVRLHFGDNWDAFVVHWQSTRLAPVFNLLDPAEKSWPSTLIGQEDIENLIARPPRVSASFVGPSTPRSAEDLVALPLGELLSYLDAWKPSGDWGSPSREGLGRALAAAVAMQPRQFAPAADQFVGHDPAYVRAVVSGLRTAVSAGSRFPWRSVFVLLDWVTDQSLDVQHADWHQADRDPGWGWTWTEIARLLSDAMAQPTSGLPRSSARRIWAVLAKLLLNPEPTVEYEREFGGDNMDPATLAINTGRGEALHAVIRFAWWETKGIGPIRHDVRRVLEYHASPSRETSFAIHSVYGRWLSVLVALDSSWVKSVLPDIFPTDDGLSDYWQAAWDSYILFDRPTRLTFEALGQQYRRAFRETLSSRDERHARDRTQSTAQHVTLYYLWGLIALTDEDSLLQCFLREAPDNARAEMTTFAGRILRIDDSNGSDAISAAQVELLMDLWIQRRNRIAGKESHSQHELAAFAWWCGAHLLEAEWWLPQLDWVTSSAVAPDPDFLVLESLSSAASVDPVTTARVLLRLLDLTSRPWTFSGHQDDVKEVVSKIMSSRESAAQLLGRRLIHELGARELADLSDLL